MKEISQTKVQFLPKLSICVENLYKYIFLHIYNKKWYLHNNNLKLLKNIFKYA